MWTHHSKKVLLKHIGGFNYEAFTNLQANITLPDISPLEAFQNLGPVQQAGITGGISLAMFGLCCGAVCCFLFRKRLCSMTCTSPAPAHQDPDRPVPHTPPPEESLRQQLRAAARFHIHQLNSGQPRPEV